jgi:heterodisulfide reductase subunit C
MHEEKTPTTFADEVAHVPGGEGFQTCYACGTCVSRCIVPWRDPTYNPRRVFYKAALSMRQSVFEDTTIWYCTACDLCYSSCPQQIHISDVIGALRQLALEAGYTSPLETVSVDPILCSGCGSCVKVCPYDALRLEVRGNARISTVDHNRCMGCGVCVAVCPNEAIGGGSFADQPIHEQLTHLLQEWA